MNNCVIPHFTTHFISFLTKYFEFFFKSIAEIITNCVRMAAYNKDFQEKE